MVKTDNSKDVDSIDFKSTTHHYRYKRSRKKVFVLWVKSVMDIHGRLQCLRDGLVNTPRQNIHVAAYNSRHRGYGYFIVCRKNSARFFSAEYVSLELSGNMHYTDVQIYDVLGEKLENIVIDSEEQTADYLKESLSYIKEVHVVKHVISGYSLLKSPNVNLLRSCGSVMLRKLLKCTCPAYKP